mmetsp:Transcript_8575/g.13060  ORF Transcript_8575/g.13060 Transcript_8575/m.13060 type:complete len:329 (+) Transcript_8575:1-987(+)
MKLPKEIQFIIYFFGIYGFYLLFSIKQEQILTTSYPGIDGRDDKFPSTFVLVGFCTFVNCMFALIIMKVRGIGLASIGFLPFAPVSASYVLAMLCSNLAVAFVSYPTQVLGKSCKPVFVIVMQFFILRRIYPAIKYISVVVVVLGIALFFYNPEKPSDGKETSVYGLLLILASLMFDGGTGSLQDRLVNAQAEKGRPLRPEHLMFYFNAWATLYLFLFTSLSGELFQSVHFVISHPSVLTDLAGFTLTSALGQVFIHRMVHGFGSLIVSTVTTVRKFFTIVVSALMFGHQIVTRQWIGVAIVFFGLGLDVFIKYYLKKVQSKNFSKKV